MPLAAGGKCIERSGPLVRGTASSYGPELSVRGQQTGAVWSPRKSYPHSAVRQHMTFGKAERAVRGLVSTGVDMLSQFNLGLRCGIQTLAAIRMLL